MSLPHAAGIQDQEFNSVFKTLNFPQRQVYVVVSVLLGGMIGGFSGILIGWVYSQIIGKGDSLILLSSTSSGLVCGALLLGIICSTNRMFDLLGYAFHAVILIVLFPLFFENFPSSYLGLTLLTIIVLAILFLIMKEKRFFIDFQVRILRLLNGNRISAKG